MGGSASSVGQGAVRPLRRGSRMAVMLKALLRGAADPAGIGEQIEVHDVSAGGLRGRGPAGLVIGDEVSVSLPALGPVEARVRWIESGEFGAEFTGAPDLRRAFLAGLAAPYPTVMTRRAA